MKKQNEILKFLSTVDKADINEIYRNVSFGYYTNEMQHLGNILSRMVKNGSIERVKKGVFKYIQSSKAAKKETDNFNQLDLF